MPLDGDAFFGDICGYHAAEHLRLRYIYAPFMLSLMMLRDAPLVPRLIFRYYFEC